MNVDGLAKDGTISGIYSEFAFGYRVSIQRVMLESKFKIPFAVAKQTKHGHISLVLSTKPFKTDLTVCVDVSSNPGPQICSGISELDKSSCARGQSCSMNTQSTRYNHVNRFRRIESPRRLVPVCVNHMAIPTIISNSRYRQKKHIKQVCRSSCRINITMQGRSTTPQTDQSLPQSGRGKNITIVHLNVRSLKKRTLTKRLKHLLST